MSSWFSGMDLPTHSLGYHTPLRTDHGPRRLRADTYDTMLHTFDLGTAHDGPTHDVTTDIGRRFDPVVADLLQGAFLCGNGSRGADETTGRHASVRHACESCAGIKRFVRAFLAMDCQDRERAFVAAKASGGRMLQAAIVGALCEAHAVSVFLDAEYSVLESTVDEDVNLEVNLVALLPGALDGHVIQVRSDRAISGIEVLRVERTPETRPTWEKTERFNRAYSVDFSPVSVRVGTGNGGLFNYRDPARLAAAIDSVRVLRDPS